jgi:hypothetical protein
MNKEWSEEGLDFEAKVKVSDLNLYGVQKVVNKDDEEDNDE